MTHCLYCAEPIDPQAVLCGHCGKSQRPPTAPGPEGSPHRQGPDADTRPLPPAARQDGPAAPPVLRVARPVWPQGAPAGLEPGPPAEVDPDADTVISAGTFERMLSAPTAAGPAPSTAAGTLESEPRPRSTTAGLTESRAGVSLWAAAAGVALLTIAGVLLIILAFRW